MIQVFDCHLSTPSCEEAVAVLSRELAKAGAVVDAAAFATAVDERESAMSTWLGHGVAMPHARSDLSQSLALAVGRCEAGIPWPDDGRRVHLVVLVAVPPCQVAEYLAAVRRIMKALASPAWRAQIMAAENNGALRETWTAGTT